jgi:hypothetical protein
MGEAMTKPTQMFEYEVWDHKDPVQVGCRVVLLRTVTEGDGHRHGSYKLWVSVEGPWSFSGQYLLRRVRNPSGHSTIEATDILPPRTEDKWFWHPEDGWNKSPIGALDWVEDRVLLWVYGMDELLDVIDVE